MPNQPIPSLIIGLGGTGALVLAHIKQQLLNSYDNEIPKTVGLLALDTTSDPLAGFKSSQSAREEGTGMRADALYCDAREYGHMGGDVSSMIESVARDPNAPQNQHLSSWLKADHYMMSLPRELRSLDHGAGQFRQLGRLALFRDVAAPGASQFYHRLNEKIGTIQRASETGTLAVFVVGSLVGGTGAGLFLDTAYLARTIGAMNNFSVRARGYFFLPETFEAIMPWAEMDHARARSFAALRELSRFIVHDEKDEVGYPFFYHSERAAHGDLWRGRLQQKLYDLVYLIDGHNPGSQLRRVSIADGVAPSVADAILSFIDSNAGGYQDSYTTNIHRVIDDLHASHGPEPYIGAIGSYTIVLPIQQIIDAWAFKLGRATLEILLAPVGMDASPNLPTGLRADANPERDHSPLDEVSRLMHGRTPIPNPKDPQMPISGTPLWAKLIDWYDRSRQPESRLMREMTHMRFNDWLEALSGRVSDTGSEISPTEYRARQILEVSVASSVELSSELDGSVDPARDSQRIRHEVEMFFDQCLGPPLEGGRREGSQFREALQGFVNFQITRFQTGLKAYVIGQLNGEDGSNAETARQGKLGWTIAVMRELQQMLAEVRQVIQQVRNDRGVTTRRANALSMLDDSYRRMAENRRPDGLFNRAARRILQEYLDAAEVVFDVHRIEIAQAAVEQTVDRMLTFTTDVLDQLENWAQILGLHHNSLYARMHSGAEQINDERATYRNIPSRAVIDDPAWEQERYAAYVAANNARHRALSSMEWRTRSAADQMGNPVMCIELFAGETQLSDEFTGEWSSRNMHALLDMCREMFASARESESVVHYLAEVQYKDRSQALASELSTKGAALLDFAETKAPAHTPAFYLLAYEDVTHAGDTEFVQRLTEHLRTEHGLSETDEIMAHHLPGSDRFRLALVSMTGVIPLTALNGYDQMREAYNRVSTTERELLHIFPAEVQIVQYEDSLPRVLNQDRRPISPRVAVLMEDHARFQLFHQLMATIIIALDRDYLNETQNEFVYFLTTDPIDPNSGEDNEEWWLTPPSTNPSLLEAMRTFIFRGEDVGHRTHQPGFTKPIAYAHVERYLLHVYQAETDQRVADDVELAPTNPALQQMLAEVEEGRAAVATRLVVEHDLLVEHREYLLSELARVDEVRQSLGASLDSAQQQDQHERQMLDDLFDLYSLSVVVVDDMIQARYQSALIAAGYREQDILKPGGKRRSTRRPNRRD